MHVRGGRGDKSDQQSEAEIKSSKSSQLEKLELHKWLIGFKSGNSFFCLLIHRLTLVWSDYNRFLQVVSCEFTRSTPGNTWRWWWRGEGTKTAGRVGRLITKHLRVVQSVKPGGIVGFLPAGWRFSSGVLAGSRQCKPDTASDTLSSSSVSKSAPESRTNQNNRHFFGGLPAPGVFLLQFLSARLRCLGREGKSTPGCRRPATRKRTASCGGVLGGRSEGTAELSADTRRGTRRRSRHTCGHQHTTRSSTRKTRHTVLHCGSV